MRRAKKGRQRIRARGLEAKITYMFIGTALCQSTRRISPVRIDLQPKPAFSSLDRVSLVPTADSWAARSGSALSFVLAGSVGFQVSAPCLASADCYTVGCDFLDLTF